MFIGLVPHSFNNTKKAKSWFLPFLLFFLHEVIVSYFLLLLYKTFLNESSLTVMTKYALRTLVNTYLGQWLLAQLVKRSLPTPEVRGSNPLIGKVYIERLLSTATKIKKKEAWNGPIGINLGWLQMVVLAITLKALIHPSLELLRFSATRKKCQMSMKVAQKWLH